MNNHSHNIKKDICLSTIGFTEPTSRASWGQEGYPSRGFGLGVCVLLLAFFWGVFSGCSKSTDAFGPGESGTASLHQFEINWLGLTTVSPSEKKVIEDRFVDLWRQSAKAEFWVRQEKCEVLVHVVREKNSDSEWVEGLGIAVRCGKGDSISQVSTINPLVQGAVVGNEGLYDALKVALVEVEDRLRVQKLSERGLLAVFAGKNRSAVSEAAAECVNRKLSNCAGPLLHWIHVSPPLSTEIIGALGLLGHEKHLSALAKLTASKEPETLQAVVYAIQEIGGSSAERYLEAISASHPMEGIRSLAVQLLHQRKERF